MCFVAAGFFLLIDFEAVFCRDFKDHCLNSEQTNYTITSSLTWTTSHPDSITTKLPSDTNLAEKNSSKVSSQNVTA